VDAGSLFGINMTKLAVRRGAYLRSFVYAFIEAFAPTLTRQAVDEALGSGAAEEDERELMPATTVVQLLSRTPSDGRAVTARH
jgi:LysR family cys regulon transcriptional activator